MRIALALALAFALLTLESVLVQFTSHSVARIDVTVVIVAFLALRGMPIEGAVSSFGVGYLLDVMSGRPTGLYTFLAVLAFVVGKLCSSLLDVRSARLFAVYAMAVDAGHAFLGFVVQALVTRDPLSLEPLYMLPVQLVLTGAAAVALFPVLLKLDPGDARPHQDLLR
jgi:hypothetical protein